MTRSDSRFARLITFLILLGAFGLRIYQLDAVRANYDHVMPHSLGIQILDLVSQGRWSALPVLGISSSVLVMNPIGASYLWAVVGLFDRDLYSALALSVMLNVLAVAMLFDLGRRLFGWRVGWVAALVLAANPWSIFFVRGSWLQGQLEFASIASAWLIWLAFHKRSPKRLFVGCIFIALMMQTYLVAMGLLAQLFIFGGIAVLRQRAMRVPSVIGLGICLASALIFLAIVFTQQGDIQNTVRAGLSAQGRPEAADAKPGRLSAAQLGLQRLIENVSGAGFDNTQQANAFAKTLADGRNLILTALFVVGTGLALLSLIRSKDRAPYAQLLLWAGLPVLAVTVLNFHLSPLNGQYLLLAQPAGYLLVALPFCKVFTRLRSAFRSGVMVSGIAMLGLSGWWMQAQVESTWQHPYMTTLSFEMIAHYPLRTQRELGALWRRECKEVTADIYGLLLASANQSTRNIREQASRVGTWDGNRDSDVLEIRPNGGTCVTRDSQPPAAWADRFDWTMPDGITITTYRSKPVTEEKLLQSYGLSGFQSLSLNLGWTLIGLTTTQQIHAGEAFSATHIWRIDTLPNEQYLNWDFSVYAKLIKPNGASVALADHVFLPAPSAWRAGDYVIQVARLRAPADLAPGDYKLELSVFDDQQRKNAVYFDAREPTKPLVVLQREIRCVRLL